MCTRRWLGLDLGLHGRALSHFGNCAPVCQVCYHGMRAAVLGDTANESYGHQRYQSIPSDAKAAENVDGGVPMVRDVSPGLVWELRRKPFRSMACPGWTLRTA